MTPTLTPMCSTDQCNGSPKKKGLCLRHYRAQYYQKNKLSELARTHAFKRSFHGRILVAYKKLRERCQGKGQKEGYTGLPFLPKEDFQKWAESCSTYQQLFRDWDAAGFPLSLTPTIDRIDSTQGYIPTNIQWLTFQANARKGNKAA